MFNERELSGMQYVNLQLNAFLVLLFTGMVWGGFFDLYRVFRSRIKVNKTIDFIGDLIFWILVVILVIPLIYWGTWLELRFYVWISIMVGLVIYFCFLSRLFIPLFKIFWQIVGWLPRVVINLIWHLGLNTQRVIRIFRKNRPRDISPDT
jgi:spore cortex biosynthesis protein YabQ